MVRKSNSSRISSNFSEEPNFDVIKIIGDEKRQEDHLREVLRTKDKEPDTIQEWLDKKSDPIALREEQYDEMYKDHGAEQDSFHYYKTLSNKGGSTKHQHEYEQKYDKMWSDLGAEIPDVIAHASTIGIESRIDRRPYKYYFESQVRGWLNYLNNGFNILFSGVGSKFDMLNTIVALVLKYKSEFCFEHLFLVSGYDTNITLKQVLSVLCYKLNIDSVSDKVEDLIDALCKNLSCEEPITSSNPLSNLLSDLNGFASQEDEPGVHQPVYVFIHNIDGPAFRSVEAQQILSMLAKCDRVRMVATVDHVNSGLLWDDMTESRFSFARFDVTPYGLYRQESQFIKVNVESGAKTTYVSAVDHILKSVTPKHVDLYVILLEHCNKRTQEGVD
ncbi:hypothetical protein AKO1_008606 [Acrasis kona]|uniref:Origin recognition complex subunit 2 n=1 Tax=Acrasis kona TaxID=1008807 RepID=A0AAW2YLY1_9EUKA